MKKEGSQRLAHCLFAVAAGVLALLCLNFPLQTVQGFSARLFDRVMYAEAGFDLLSCNSIFMSEGYQWGAAVIGALCIVQVAVGAVSLILPLLAYAVCSEKACRRICLACIVLCMSFLLLYLVEGVVFNAIYRQAGEYVAGIGSLYDASVSTLAYIPFVIGCLLLAAYLTARLRFHKGGSGAEGENTFFEEPPTEED